MSGGSMNYLCHDVEEATFDTNTVERKAFAEHLKKVAKALHDIEWVDSGDYAPGDETAAIRDCISKPEMLETALKAAIAANLDLTKAIEDARK